MNVYECGLVYRVACHDMPNVWDQQSGLFDWDVVEPLGGWAADESSEPPKIDGAKPISMPIQGGDRHGRGQGCVRPEVYLRAYEVYCVVYCPQPAMIDGECRGGFGKNELVALLYASGFPRREWSDRVDEAFKGMRL